MRLRHRWAVGLSRSTQDSRTTCHKRVPVSSLVVWRLIRRILIGGVSGRRSRMCCHVMWESRSRRHLLCRHCLGQGVRHWRVHGRPRLWHRRQRMGQRCWWGCHGGGQGLGHGLWHRWRQLRRQMLLCNHRLCWHLLVRLRSHDNSGHSLIHVDIKLW